MRRNFRYAMVAAAGLLVVLAGTAHAVTCGDAARACRSNIEMFSDNPLCVDQFKDVIKYHSELCFPRGSMTDVEAAFVQWLDKHPESADINAVDCMTAAMREMYPCDKSPR